MRFRYAAIFALIILGIGLWANWPGTAPVVRCELQHVTAQPVVAFVATFLVTNQSSNPVDIVIQVEAFDSKQRAIHATKVLRFRIEAGQEQHMEALFPSVRLSDVQGFRPSQVGLQPVDNVTDSYFEKPRLDFVIPGKLAIRARPEDVEAVRREQSR